MCRVKIFKDGDKIWKTYKSRAEFLEHLVDAHRYLANHCRDEEIHGSITPSFINLYNAQYRSRYSSEVSASSEDDAPLRTKVPKKRKRPEEDDEDWTVSSYMAQKKKKRPPGKRGGKFYGRKGRPPGKRQSAEAAPTKWKSLVEDSSADSDVAVLMPCRMCEKKETSKLLCSGCRRRTQKSPMVRLDRSKVTKYMHKKAKRARPKVLLDQWEISDYEKKKNGEESSDDDLLMDAAENKTSLDFKPDKIEIEVYAAPEITKSQGKTDEPKKSSEAEKSSTATSALRQFRITKRSKPSPSPYKQTTTTEGVTEYRCCLCEEVSSTEEEAKSHASNFHPSGSHNDANDADDDAPTVPANKFCKLCASVEEDFVTHLIVDHYKVEIKKGIPGCSRSPFLCGRCNAEFDSCNDLVHHVGSFHHEALRLYYRPERLQSGFIYQCVLCKNRDITFLNVTEMRSHLAKTHLMPLLVKNLRTYISDTTFCPQFNCRERLHNRQQMIEHFLREHGEAHNLGPSSSEDEFKQLQWRLCPDCGHLAQDFDMLTHHSVDTHPERLNMIVKQTKIGALLQPVSQIRKKIEVKQVVKSQKSLKREYPEEERDSPMQKRVQDDPKLAYYRHGPGKGMTFVQEQPCYKIERTIQYCHTCHLCSRGLVSKEDVVCQFEGFRKIRSNDFGSFEVAGFLDPETDPTDIDRSLWLPLEDNVPEDLDLDTARFILTHLGKEFCKMVEEEEKVAKKFLENSQQQVRDKNFRAFPHFMI